MKASGWEAVSLTVSGDTRKCAICQKEIFARESWAYKIAHTRHGSNYYVVFCSYGHMRQAERMLLEIQNRNREEQEKRAKEAEKRDKERRREQDRKRKQKKRDREKAAREKAARERGKIKENSDERKNAPLTQAQEDEIRRCFADGMTTLETAQKAGVSRRTVYRRFDKLKEQEAET